MKSIKKEKKTGSFKRLGKLVEKNKWSPLKARKELESAVEKALMAMRPKGRWLGKLYEKLINIAFLIILIDRKI